MNNLSENIKKYRKKLNLTQSDLADKLFVTKQAVSKWETGRGFPESSLIPDLAKALNISIDKLMGKIWFSKKKIILISITSFLIVMLLIFMPSFVDKYRDFQAYSEFTNHIESQLEIDLPRTGTLEYSDYDQWFQYGNSMSISIMSYLIFSNNNQISSFEKDMANDSRWLSSIPEESMPLIPVFLEEYAESGTYYLIYNVTKDTFNDFTELSDVSEYIFIVYQEEYHRLLIFDYYI